VRFYSTVDLVNALEREKAEGKAGRIAANLMRVDAVILADPGLMRYAADHYPELRLHLSVQGSPPMRKPSTSIRSQFGVARAVLPRVLSLAQGTRSLAEAVVGHEPLVVLSGPEGGLSPAEEALALGAGFVPVTLGSRVLRAETAPLAVLAALTV